jgi:hypothetical protein
VGPDKANRWTFTLHHNSRRATADECRRPNPVQIDGDRFRNSELPVRKANFAEARVHGPLDCDRVVSYAVADGTQTPDVSAVVLLCPRLVTHSDQEPNGNVQSPTANRITAASCHRGRHF